MFDTSLWLGSQETCDFALHASAQAVQMLVGGRSLNDGLPEMLTVQDGVGVVSIRGSLVPGSAGFMRYFGAVGYNDIREALVAAANHPDVKAIVLDVNSGGGAVAGVADTAKFISQVDALKPVVTYADGAMASGAYWLGSAGRRVLASSTSIVGSIGVIMTHTEVSKMRQEAGVTDTVIRAGTHKALAGPYEPLSDTAKAELQTQAEDIYKVFGSWVAERRKVSYSKMDATMGQGREFIGEKAVGVGLVDKIGSFEDAIAVAKSLAPVDSRKPISQNSRQTQGANVMPKATLTDAQIAAIQSGASLEIESPTAEQVTAAEAEAATQVQAEVEAQAAPAVDAGTTQAQAAPAPQVESELVKFLRSELSTANANLLAEKVKSTTLETQMQAVTGTHDKLLAIARGAVGKMQIALGGADGAQAMTDVQVVAAHAEISATFLTKFKVGGVAAATAEDTKPAAVAQPKDARPPVLRAVVNSVKTA